LAFRITLHTDDTPILYRIQEYLGLGNVEKQINSSVYVVRDVKGMLKRLVPILEANPLQTVKYLDYLDFKKMLLLLSESKNTAVTGEDKVLALSIIQGMNSGRLSYNKDLIPLRPINKYWLLGFIEGEGTSRCQLVEAEGLKNLVPLFSKQPPRDKASL